MSAAVAGAPARRPPPAWPVLLLAIPAFVAIWSGWVGLGGLTGFGEIHPLPGIWDSLSINTAITLPIGMEAYAAYAIKVWLTDGGVPARARDFARASAIGALLLGALGQVAYHLMASNGVTTAHWTVTTLVACLPVGVLGMGAALAHLLREEPDQPATAATTPAPAEQPVVAPLAPPRPLPLRPPGPNVNLPTAGTRQPEPAPAAVPLGPPVHAARAVTDTAHPPSPSGTPAQPDRHTTGAAAAERHTVPRHGRSPARAAAGLSDEAARAAARAYYLQQLAKGVPPTGAELGARFERSARWGRAQAAQAAASTTSGGKGATARGAVVTMPRHRAAPGGTA